MDALAQLASKLDLAGPMEGAARSPGGVDGFWWLTLPAMQACLELGIGADQYPRVRKDVEAMADAAINARLQGGEDIPLTLKRRRTRRLAPLLAGGKIQRIRTR